MSNTTNRTIAKFMRTRTLTDCIPLIRCGLEFEFQELGGQRQADMREEALREASQRAWDELPISDRVDTDDPEGALIYALDHLDGSIADISNSRLQSRLYEYLDAGSDEWREQWESDNRDSYETDYRDALQHWGSVRHLAQCGEDGSVSGGEIRTVGPRSIPEFRKVCKALSRNEFRVDDECSFHIHLSLPGVQHTWGARFQAEMYAYILSNADRLPEGVRDRLMRGGARWARFQLSNAGKHVAIYKHGQNSWEFRLFGNVTEYADMIRCLELAVGALRHAYCVRAGQCESLLQGITNEAFSAALEAAYNYSDLDLLLQSVERARGDSEATRPIAVQPIELAAA